MVRRARRSKEFFMLFVNMDVDTRRRRREKHMAKIRHSKRNALLRGLEMSRKKHHASRKNLARKHLISCLKVFSRLVDGASSHDNNLLLMKTIQICELLSTKQKPPIDGDLQLKVVSTFVKLLEEDFPPLQCEATWALANIASQTPEGTKVVIELALPTFVNLLYSPNADLRDQAVFALGILAGHSPTCRDCVLGHEALGPLLELLKKDLKLSMLRNAAWTLSNFCGSRPHLSFEKVRAGGVDHIEALKSLLCSDDWEVLSDSCLTLSYLSLGGVDHIEEVIRAGVCPGLVQLLHCSSSSSVVITALHAIGNIVSGEHRQVKVILNLGALPYLLSLLTDKANDKFVKKEADKDNKFIQKSACFVISNIICGNRNRIQAVIDAGLIEPLVELLKNADVDACVRGADVDTCVRAARAISNAAYGGSFEQIKCLASKGCIEALCNLVVHSSDPCILCTCLDALCVIMEKGGTKLHSKLIRDAVGFERILVLTDDKNKQVASKARTSLWCVCFAPQGVGYI